MEEDLEAAKKTAKISRRTAKSALTRSGKLVNNLIEGKRPKQEVREMLDKLQANFNELVTKHKAYTAVIEGRTCNASRRGLGLIEENNR